MAQGTRAHWSKLLPIIEAFVNGEKIQRLNFSGRWEDVQEHLHSLLINEGGFRIKPKAIVKGIWQVDYSFKDTRVSGGSHSKGTFIWEGNSDETPKWPNISEFKIDMKTERFVKGADNESESESR